MENIQQIIAELDSKTLTIGVVGLGYVGLPLATLLASKYSVMGFDINETRITELKNGYDRTREVEEKKKLLNPNLRYTSEKKDLSKCKVIIIAVPTPIDKFKSPDLSPILAASRTVGTSMSKGTIVVYESTVYPGVTEGVCMEELEKTSSLIYGKDFYLGYSPERVNPGDKEHTIDKIIKVVSGDTAEVAEILAKIYGSVITAGIHLAPNIKTAEASKVIENTQRDINIALINELARIFDRVGLDTLEVLEAAGTKWNFLPFRPGLVGGHCIGVDPYYLTTLAQSIGYSPDVILSGRKINDQMGEFVAEKTISKILSSAGSHEGNFKVAILGVTFKENVPDIRNTKVLSIAEKLESMGIEVLICDPEASDDEIFGEYGRRLVPFDDLPQCSAVILAVKHDAFKQMSLNKLAEKAGPNKIIMDLKGILNKSDCAALGVDLWRL